MTDKLRTRLAKHLAPESEAERDAIEAIVGSPAGGLLVAMVERATKRQWLFGAEAGRREVEEEVRERRPSYKP